LTFGHTEVIQFDAGPLRKVGGNVAEHRTCYGGRQPVPLVLAVVLMFARQQLVPGLTISAMMMAPTTSSSNGHSMNG
jgi:hypothetical protein